MDFPIPFLQFGYNSIWERVRLSEHGVTGDPDTGCFPFTGHPPRLRVGPEMMCPNAFEVGCLSTLKECNVGCKYLLPLRDPQSSSIQAPFVAQTQPISTQRTSFDKTQSYGSSWTVTFGSAVFCIIYTSARFKCSAHQWTGTEESRFKSPSKGFSARKRSTSKTLSRTSVYLRLPFWLHFTFLLSSPFSICLIRLHFIPTHIWP